MQLMWRSAEQTHCGKRRKNNEDAVLSRPDARLWAVADGMGGHEAGEVASQAVADALQDLALSGMLSEDVDAVEDALVSVNDELRVLARNEGLQSTIGTTVVALLTTNHVGVVLWAGDSRLYRLRGSSLEQVTRDHNPVSDLLESGTVTEADALAADTNIITRAVGGQSELYLDIAVFDVGPNDTFLLCSDGLYRELEGPELVAELRRDTVDDIVENLLRKCLEGAARDNVSIVVARPEMQCRN
jgi:protein phosphatase